jgi:hypothetical protein
MLMAALGAMAEWLRSGLQSRVHRFDSGWRLSHRSRSGPGGIAQPVSGDPSRGKRNLDGRREQPSNRERFYGSKEAAVIDPMLVILAPPAVVFAWAMVQMHNADKAQAEPAAKVKR